jgi:hypothetical protein
MNARQIKMLRITKQVQTVLQAHESITNGYPIFANHTARLNTLIQDIDTIAPQQERNSIGATEDKNTLKDALEHTLYKLSLSLSTYADDLNDKFLYRQVKYSKTNFQLAKDLELIPMAEFLIEKAEAHLEQLGNYLIDANKLNGIKEQLNTFKGIVLNPEQQRNEQALVTENVKLKFAELKETLQDLDRWVKLIADDHLDFARTYQQAR